jgi:transposase-like protein
LERVNREIGRRSDVVGIYPNDAALLRLAGMLLLEQNDDHQLHQPVLKPALYMARSQIPAGAKRGRRDSGAPPARVAW